LTNCAAQHVRRGRYGNESAGTDRSDGRRRVGIPVSVRDKGRRLRKQDHALPGNEGAFEPGDLREISCGENEDTWHRRLSSLSSRVCDRRYVGRGVLKNREARDHGLSRSSADLWKRAWARVSGCRVGREDASGGV